MPHKIKQFTVLYLVADPNLQIRRGGGGGADHPDPEIGEGGTQFGLQMGGGVTSPGMKLRKQANEMIFHFPSQSQPVSFHSEAKISLEILPPYQLC